MRTAWLLSGPNVLASAEVAENLADRTRGLIGRRDFDGAMVLLRTRSVHSFGVPYALDVAFLDPDLNVVATVRLRRWSITRPRKGCCHVLEARSGAFERWGLRPGDKVELRETA